MRRLLLSGCAATIGLLALAACDAESANPITGGSSNDGGTDATQPVEAGAGDAGRDSGAAADSGVAQTGDASDADAGSPSDGAPSDGGNAGTALVTGTNLTIVGITSQGIVIYSDGTNYSGVPLSGGAPTVITPMAGIDHTVISGPTAFFWGPSQSMILANGCVGCVTPVWSVVTNLSPYLTAEAEPVGPIASADGQYFAVAVPTTDNDGSSTYPTLKVGHLSDDYAPVVQTPPCFDAIQFAPNDDLDLLYGTFDADAGHGAGHVAVLQPNSETAPPVFSNDTSLPYACAAQGLHPFSADGQWVAGATRSGNVTLIHLPDGATHVVPPPDGSTNWLDGFLFDGAGTSLYAYGFYGAIWGIERISLSDFSTTFVSTNGCSSGIAYAISPDGTSVQCQGGLVSLQTGAWTSLPGDTLTDDWSYVYWVSSASVDGGSVYGAWTEQVGGFEQMALGTSPDQSLLSIHALSNSTLLVRNGNLVQVFDATGAAKPVAVASTVDGVASAWALSSDRKLGAYVTHTAPAGLYAVAIP